MSASTRMARSPTPRGSMPRSSSAYDPTTSLEVIDWVAHHGDRLMLVYGQWDPWTAGAVELGDAHDSVSYTIPEVGHWAKLELLDDASLAGALARLSAWSGVTASFPSATARRRRDPAIEHRGARE